MSHFAYEASKQIVIKYDSFSACIMGAMRKADSSNLSLLQSVFPDIWAELCERYDAPGGLLEGEYLITQETDVQ